MQTGNWGAFILSGQNKGLSTIRYREILYPARGVMTDYSQTKTDSDSVRSYPVAVFRETTHTSWSRTSITTVLTWCSPSIPTAR